MREKPVNLISVRFKSIPENVSLARVLVASIGAQADLTISELDELKVAVSEAVSNAIIHGYRNDPEKIVALEVSLFADRLVMMVSDDGVGIEDVKAALEPAFSTDTDRMGLGFVFMQSFTDRLEVDSQPQRGTRVTMMKNLVFRQES